MRKIVGTAVVIVASAGLLAAAPTWAVDGIVLIDQNKALAGGITPGDAPGFPVSITRPGSYRLASNLTVPDENTSGIIIDASNVTLDLNGFAILGPTDCSGGLNPCARQGTSARPDGESRRRSGRLSSMSLSAAVRSRDWAGEA